MPGMLVNMEEHLHLNGVANFENLSVDFMSSSLMMVGDPLLPRVNPTERSIFRIVLKILLMLLLCDTFWAIHNSDLMETDVRSMEEHLAKLLKCLVRCRCYCAIMNLWREGPKSSAFPVAGGWGRGRNALQRWCLVLGARCRRAGQRLKVFERLRVGLWSGASRMLHRQVCGTGSSWKGEFSSFSCLREMMGLSRDFELFLPCPWPVLHQVMVLLALL
ncbi:uncharacterized protein LOC134358443 [Mobula hypostoma]|uniref:uncharacterized protein LOC134358443 n=1 Tax=Mobula hypostoma TaxID=723540 RepID=UPI002FC3CF07